MERRQVLSAACGTLPLAGCLLGSDFAVEGAETTVTEHRCIDGAETEGSVRFDGRDAVVVTGDLLLHTRCDAVNVNVFTSNAERERGKAVVEVMPVRPRGTTTSCEHCDDQPVCTYETRVTFSDRVTGVDLLHGLPDGESTDVAVEHRE
ncbi:hypothetical protein [Haloarchaeobius iranensis]|uniref:Uncharacterized protein n=1 Tax=Haloarchaeobius iranensis TaxID=996166 RepID=A0A1G9UF19_9EURY|nr:hypothetical protein [Haloarchaeobius iranensis]SDM58506.1 hypothetical protein SAMN05192554_10493 [Haloarchaeobius iranensis]